MLRDVFKSPTGAYDSARILYIIGGLNGIFSPVGFTGWAMYRGQTFDVAAYCLAYGGMLSAIISLGAYGIKTKDNGVADTINKLPGGSDAT